jgi:hypothetical protein
MCARLRRLQLDFRHATGFLSTIRSSATRRLAKPLAADFFARDVENSECPSRMNFNVAFQMRDFGSVSHWPWENPSFHESTQGQE